MLFCGQVCSFVGCVCEKCGAMFFYSQAHAMFGGFVAEVLDAFVGRAFRRCYNFGNGREE